MQKLALTLAALLACGSCLADDLWLHIPPAEGKANGKKVVLISGDEEYRSEEVCPALAKILSQHHGFDTTVLFAINPDGGYIDPNFSSNIPGLEALADADLLIIGTRFRKLSTEQLAPLAEYLNSGRPVIGFRTATHAFTGGTVTGDFNWNQFGLLILGEQWVAHHGRHGVEGARGVIEQANADHPVLQGVTDVFGPSDVYTVKNLDEEKATVLLRGAVTETLDPSSKILADDPRNNPMMALAWIHEYTSPDGGAKGKAFTTTMGASQDIVSDDLRRLFVNASLYLVGLEVPAAAEVGFVDPFEPTRFAFIRAENFFKERNLKPSDFGLGKAAATGLPDN